MRAKSIEFGTGVVFNRTRRSAPPARWEKTTDVTTVTQRMNDGNGRSLALEESVWLTVRIGNILNRVSFIAADGSAVELLIRTAFLNCHVS